MITALCALPSLAEAQPTLDPDMRVQLDRLQQGSSPAVRPLIQAGRVSWVGGLNEPLRVTDPERGAIEFLGRFNALAGIGDTRNLALHSVRDHAGTTYVRYNVEHQGWPVIGSQVIVSIRNGMVRHLASGARQWESVVEAPRISAEAAARAVEEASGRGAQVPDDMAWLNASGQLVPVWVVTQRTREHDWRFIVDATYGRVIWRHDQRMTADGYVYDPSPEASGGVVSTVELPLLTSDTVLEGELARAWQCIDRTGDCDRWGGECNTCGVAEHYATADADGNFLYEPSEPDTSDPFAEVQAYYHATQFNRWMSEEVGFERRCGGRAIDVFVNYHVPGDTASSANAFYGDSNGDGCGDITLGEGMGVDFAYDGDVIFHEFTHGVVEGAGGLGCAPFGACQDELGLDWTSIGLNEGYADYFAVSYTGDPELAEHVGPVFYTGEGSLRNADNDNLCPFELIGESHFDGQIWAGTGWDIREAVGQEVADRMMMAVLLSLTEDAGYAEAAEGLQQAADTELDFGDITEDEHAQIERILGPEGRRIAGCERIVPLDEIPYGHHEEYMMLYTYFPGMTLPAGLQWSLTTPRRPSRLEFRVEEDRTAADALTLHVRAGEPVGVSLTMGGGGPVTTFEADFSVVLEDHEFVWRDGDDELLEGETTYYFALEYACSRGCYLRARGDVDGIPNEPPEAVAGEDQEVELEAVVELDGSESSDPEGDELTFAWSVVEGPEGIILEGEDTATPSFVASAPGVVELSLVVADTEGDGDEDTVTVTIVEPEPEDDDDGGCGCRSAGSTQRSIGSLVRSLLP